MSHPIYRVLSCEIVAPFVLHVGFDDGTEQTINFESVLHGPMFGPLRELKVFNAVQIDSEVHNLIWPKGADFDPATLHDWPQYADELKKRAQSWELASV